MDDIADQLRAAGAGKIYPISGATGAGVPELLDEVMILLGAAKAEDVDQDEGDQNAWSPL